MTKTSAVPIWEKEFLTLNEAADYLNIGVNTLRKMTNEPHCDYVMFVGKKRLINRKKIVSHLQNVYSM